MNSSNIVLTSMPDNVYKNSDYNKIEGSSPFHGSLRVIYRSHYPHAHCLVCNMQAVEIIYLGKQVKAPLNKNRISSRATNPLKLTTVILIPTHNLTQIGLIN
jgi:hypothetical protein